MMLSTTSSPLILAALLDKGVGRKEGVPCFSNTTLPPPIRSILLLTVAPGVTARNDLAG